MIDKIKSILMIAGEMDSLDEIIKGIDIDGDLSIAKVRGCTEELLELAEESDSLLKSINMTMSEVDRAQLLSFDTENVTLAEVKCGLIKLEDARIEEVDLIKSDVRNFVGLTPKKIMVYPKGGRASYAKTVYVRNKDVKIKASKTTSDEDISSFENGLTEKNVGAYNKAHPELPIEFASQDALTNFNDDFKGLDPIEMVNDIKKSIEEGLGKTALYRIIGGIDIDSTGAWTLKVEDSSGNFAMTRSFAKLGGFKQVNHKYFKLDPSIQESGFSKEIFKGLYKQYRKMNLDGIKVVANIDVGGYTWAQYGLTVSKSGAKDMLMNFKAGSTKRNIKLKDRTTGNVTVEDVTIAASHKSKADEAYKAFYRERENANKRFPMHLIANIGKNNKASKAALLGTTWSGELDLRNDAQRTHFENYMGFEQ